MWARTMQRRNSWREENLTLAVFAMEESLTGWFLKFLRIMGGGNKCKILVNRATKNVPRKKKKMCSCFYSKDEQDKKKKFSDDRKPVGRDGESTD